MGDSIDQVVDWHAQYLVKTFGNPSDELKLFVDRLKNGRESARAEAVIFAWLRQIGKNPTINEKAGTGGMDFKCRPAIGGDFLVEVTSYGTEALSLASGLSQDLTRHSGGAYKMVTTILKRRVGDKIDQLKTGGTVPRMLVITSEHPKVHLVFNRAGATCLLVSDWTFCVPHSDPSAVFQFTDLKNSVFFRSDENNSAKLIPLRCSASAVLLACILRDEIRAVGVIHPAPKVPFDISCLPEVPLLYLPSWPPENEKLEPEWTLPSDPPFPEHRRVRI